MDLFILWGYERETKSESGIADQVGANGMEVGAIAHPLLNCISDL